MRKKTMTFQHTESGKEVAVTVIDGIATTNDPAFNAYFKGWTSAKRIRRTMFRLGFKEVPDEEA